MNYKESIEFIEAVSWKGSVPGLERIGELCHLLGDPQNKLKFVHIAGTNGKGSVSAIVSSVLSKAGYRTGLFTSPHLVDYTERIKIDGRDITRRAFSVACAKVKRQAVKMTDAPTEFELLTAAALVCFSEADCDVAVLECGMGGRLDATNVIPSPLVSVVTNIALDHTAILGDTEAKIAYEKAGIIKCSPVVLGAASREAERVIDDKCKKCCVPLVRSHSAGIKNERLTKRGLSFDYLGQRMTLPLCGEYQKINLRTALSAIDELVKQGFDISPDDISRGVSAVRWKGRFEFLSRRPAVIFDGAHNPDGARHTAETFRELFPRERAILVTGVMADKDYLAIAKTFSSVVQSVYTVSPDNARALSAEEYAKVYSSLGVESHPCASVVDAMSSALGASHGKIPVLCTGSLYMYAQIIEALKSIE